MSDERYLKNRDSILARMRERYKDPEVRARKRAYDKQRQSDKKAMGLGAFSVAKREQHYKTRYGITIEEYNRMFESQNGCCKICEKLSNTQKRKMAVDHCHSTGRVRGLLCDPCNKGLGHFKDNPDLMLKALEYLKP